MAKDHEGPSHLSTPERIIRAPVLKAVQGRLRNPPPPKPEPTEGERLKRRDSTRKKRARQTREEANESATN